MWLMLQIVSTDLIEFLAPEVEEVSSDFLKTASSDCKKHQENSWVVGFKRMESFQQTLPNRVIGHVEPFFPKNQIGQVKNFSIPTF